MGLLKKNFLTDSLPEPDLARLAGAMKMARFQKGEAIIKYGDDGSLYYLLTQGTVKCIIYNQDTNPSDPNIDEHIMLTKDLPTGITFGELALLYNAKRSATIVANEECLCWTLDGTIFKTEIAKSSIA